MICLVSNKSSEKQLQRIWVKYLQNWPSGFEEDEHDGGFKPTLIRETHFKFQLQYAKRCS